MTRLSIFFLLPVVVFIGQASAAPAEKPGAALGPFYVNRYLCDTSNYAVAFAAAVSQGNELDMAKDIVGKIAKKEVCGRFIGIASIEAQSVTTSDGILYRVTELRFRSDNRTAWAAEPAFAPEQQSAWHL